MGKNSLNGENMAETMKELHEEIRLKIEESNAKYKSYADQKRCVKSFKEGEMVMVYLCKERFPVGSYSKLSKRRLSLTKSLRKLERMLT